MQLHQEPPGTGSLWSWILGVFDWFYEPQSGNRSVWSILCWWEQRRIVYNAILAVVGGVSLLLFFFFITHSGVLKGGEDAEEPMALFAGPIFANICYGGGGLVEVIYLLSYREAPSNIGPGLLRAGVYFSLGVVLLPSVFWFIAWMIHLF